MADTEITAVRVVVVDKTASAETTGAFVKASGYKESDILDSNEKTRTFVTKNGGKYRLSQKGGRIVHAAGPEYPKQEPESGE